MPSYRTSDGIMSSSVTAKISSNKHAQSTNNNHNDQMQKRYISAFAFSRNEKLHIKVIATLALSAVRHSKC